MPFDAEPPIVKFPSMTIAQPLQANFAGSSIVPETPASISTNPKIVGSIPACSATAVKKWNGERPGNASATGSAILSRRPWRVLWQPTVPGSVGG
jgi:hypothetical protein